MINLYESINRKNLKNLGVLILLITFIGYLPFFFNNYSLWGDELFTLDLVKLNIIDMFNATAIDIHPPLYYLMIKLFDSISPFSTVVDLKLFSLVAYFFILLTTYIILVKNLNLNIALTYVIVAVSSGKIAQYFFEARMYSLISPLVALAYILGYLIIEKSSRKYVILINIVILSSLYIHYYSVLALIPLFIYLVYYLIKQSRFKILLESVLVQIFGYLPWVFYFLSLISNNQSGFGSGFNFSFKELLVSVVVVFSNINNFLTFVLIVVCIFIITYSLTKELDGDRKYGYLCVSSMMVILAGGLLLSLLFNKFFSGKYLMISWNTFVFGLSLLIVSFSDKLRKILCIILFSLNVCTFTLVISNEFFDIKQTQQFTSFLNEQDKINVVHNYKDICSYYAKDTRIIEFSDAVNLSDAEYTILNYPLNGAAYKKYQPALIVIYVYRTSDLIANN